ncbi:Lrp/AsnC family transcriptional regulator [Streptacidiphilus sp. ASG 303]|uniref:Lrp/AsnC family transcriptional regulator n=1 Tax=Streptacidiphilus sp. ASG 303 TaxID=2896847 RepID=UPI001E423A52|nr:Lrp/AsnC family transcriptional regulator [Streptacidiphilus sp. ASG 303]MCD0484076.1 Lrp/AsnC family transcriptional regulator [Streptacidiphilus sp. ASG 303]
MKHSETGRGGVPGPGGTAVLSAADQRLVAALQCDGRAAVERLAHVLGMSTHEVHRRLRALTRDGTVRIRGRLEQPGDLGAVQLRIRVLRGRLEQIAAVLAAREDIPFLDVSAAGDEIHAVQFTRGATPHNRLLLQQLPATSAVTSVEAQTVLHVFRESGRWRLDVLDPAERQALTPAPAAAARREPDEADRAIAAALAEDGRLSAAGVAERTGHPASTVRRRLAALLAEGLLRTEVVVDPRRLGLHVDANVWLQLPPDRLDAVGRTLAAHPAVHGALAGTGRNNLFLALWLPDTAALYRFLSEDLTGLGITAAETFLVGRAVKRPD